MAMTIIKVLTLREIIPSARRRYAGRDGVQIPVEHINLMSPKIRNRTTREVFVPTPNSGIHARS